jgi:hypothetical protein
MDGFLFPPRPTIFFVGPEHVAAVVDVEIKAGWRITLSGISPTRCDINYGACVRRGGNEESCEAGKQQCIEDATNFYDSCASGAESTATQCVAACQ